MLERIPEKIPKIGVFAVAHGTYWAQFEGLKENGQLTRFEWN